MKKKIAAWLAGNAIYLFIITLVCLIVYINALSATFVSDDVAVIVQNQNIGNLASVFKEPLAFSQPLIYYLAFKIGGINPFIYHLINLFFHLGVIISLFALMTFFYEKRLAATITFIFAVHPILTESVTWISGGTYVRYSLFFVLSFIFYILSPKKRAYYYISLLLFILSLVSSEKAIPLPLIFLAYEVLINIDYQHIKTVWTEKISKLIPFILLSTLDLIRMLSTVESRQLALNNVKYAQQQLYNYNGLLQIPIAIVSYIRLLFWPDKLTVYHSEIYSYPQAYAMVGIFSLMTLFYLYCFKIHKKTAFWLTFFLITLLPTLLPLNLASSLAERYLYLGSLGIIIPLVVFVYQYYKKNQYKKFVTIIFVVVMALLSIRTVVRNFDYHSFDNFWQATLKTSPNSYQAHNNVGIILAKRGDLDGALKEFKTALSIVPNSNQAYINIAAVYFSKKDYNNALKYYQHVVKMNPEFWISYQNMAAIYFERKDYDKSLELTQKALQYSPNNVSLLNNLGLIYIKKGNKTAAKKIFETVLNIDPVNSQARRELIKLN